MSQGPSKRGIKGKGHGDQFIALGTAPAAPVPVPKPTKRDLIPSSSSYSAVKKPRLDKPVSVESYELLDRLESESSGERIVGYILSSLSSVKASRGKDSLTMLTLLYHAKNDPSPFQK